jgi:hypothetical protein
MKNCIISHGQGPVFIGPSVSFTSDHNLFYRPSGNPPIEIAGEVYSAAQVEAGAVGPGNLARDPQFLDYGSVGPEGYQLADGSPALNAGTSTGAPGDDMQHNPRPVDECDMGPFEKQSTEPNSPPSKPEVPNGPASGVSKTSYTYTTSSTDPDGDKISYQFVWGDGSSTKVGPKESGEVASASKSWASPGNYEVKTKATDSRGAASEFSDSLTVAITADTTIPTPAIPSGPSKGYTGISYAFSTTSKDPSRKRLKYVFEWGDGLKTKTGFVRTGSIVTAFHKWAAAGSYEVRAMAMDEFGDTSLWSGTKVVAILKLNRPPDRPDKPKGPEAGVKGESLVYQVRSTDPNGDMIKYAVSWGDGLSSTSTTVESGTIEEMSHSYIRAGRYVIKVRAIDEEGATSMWSNPAVVRIT